MLHDNVYQAELHLSIPMNSAIAYGQFRDHIGGSLYQWRSEATMMEKLGVAFLFAVLTALAAPGSVLSAFHSGAVHASGLGGPVGGGGHRPLRCREPAHVHRDGGTFGWFTGMVGFAALAGITGGYLLGFVAASFLLGGDRGTQEGDEPRSDPAGIACG